MMDKYSPYNKDMDSMSPAARQEAVSARKSADGSTGDAAADLLDAGVITKEQADAINAWLNK